MIEGMRRILDRMEELNNQFRGISPRKVRREKQTFAAVMNDMEKTPASKATLTMPGKPEPVSLSSPATKNIPAGDYSKIIEKYATKFQLDPKLIRRVIEVESNFDPGSVSKKGAMGLMQLMPGTARELGVVNPFDPEENIGGGTKYLASLLGQNGGDLARALASYNAGPGAVKQFGGIPPFTETKNFVDRVLSGLVPEPDDQDEL